MTTNSILRLPEVIKRTGLSRPSIYLKISKGEFPRQIKLGIKSVGWIESDVDAWIEQRIHASNPSTAA